MPIFEYKCNKCDTLFELLHKSAIVKDDISCPSCNSADINKLISTFNSSISSSGGNGCDGGSCGFNPSSFGGCSSGSCSLN